jgi:preprotein translocase subunit Sec61beta
MAESNKMYMPGPFGGLMRYDEEYQTRLKLSPSHVIAFIVAIILFVLALKIFWPISG